MLAEVAISLRVVQVKCLQSVFQLFILRIVRNHFLAVVQRTVADRCAADVQGEHIADMLCLDTSDTRDLIAVALYGLYLVVAAGEAERTAALEVERQGGLLLDH